MEVGGSIQSLAQWLPAVSGDHHTDSCSVAFLTGSPGESTAARGTTPGDSLALWSSTLAGHQNHVKRWSKI